MYCRNCGKEVHGTPFCPYCGTKAEVKSICRYCGGEIKDTPYCPHCGRIQDDFLKKTKQKRNLHKGILKKLALCSAALIILLTGIATIRKAKEYAEEKAEKERISNIKLTLPAPDVFLGEEAEIEDNTYIFMLDYCPYDEIWDYTDLLEEKYDMKLTGWSTNEKNGSNQLQHTENDKLRVQISWTHQYGGDTEVQFYYSQPIQIEANTIIKKTTDTRAEKYAEAVRLYEKGDYNPARELFESLSGYADSNKYLRLIRIRFSGGNIGVGSKVYRADCGLTESQKRDIDAAAADFYFADTAEVLVCNSDVASYFLIGEWNGGSKCYIHFIANDYGCRYNIGSKLSTNYQDTFAINDGIVYVDVVEAWTPTLKLTLTSPDCMDVYTYEKGGKSYVLTRE